MHSQRSSPRDLTFQISASSPWTDTGLNLQTGDIVTIAAVPASSVSSDNAAKPLRSRGARRQFRQERGPSGSRGRAWRPHRETAGGCVSDSGWCAQRAPHRQAIPLVPRNEYVEFESDSLSGRIRSQGSNFRFRLRSDEDESVQYAADEPRQPIEIAAGECRAGVHVRTVWNQQTGAEF